MNYTVGSCGHSKPAVGAPGSKARADSEASPCRACRAQTERDRSARVSELRLQAYCAGKAYRAACVQLVSVPHAVPLSPENVRGLIEGILETDPDSLTSDELAIVAGAYADGFNA